MDLPCCLHASSFFRASYWRSLVPIIFSISMRSLSFSDHLPASLQLQILLLMRVSSKVLLMHSRTRRATPFFIIPSLSLNSRKHFKHCHKNLKSFFSPD